MSYKPTDEDLIAYLYGEMDQVAFDKLSAYLENHPDEKERLKKLNDTRLIFSELDDDEMSEPIAMHTVNAESEWHYWRKYVAVAATILVILTFGWLSNFGLQYDEEGLVIGYAEIQKGLSENEVANIVAEDRQLLLDYVNNYVTDMSDSLQTDMRILQASLNDRSFFNNLLENEKKRILNEMLDLNDQLTENYRGTMRELIVNFSNNWQSQRIEDLKSIQAALTNLEDATVNRQVELEDELVTLADKLDAVILTMNNR